MTKLYLAIPCYNEEEVLLDSAEKLFNKYRQLMKAGRKFCRKCVFRNNEDSRENVRFCKIEKSHVFS